MKKKILIVLAILQIALLVVDGLLGYEDLYFIIIHSNHLKVKRFLYFY